MTTAAHQPESLDFLEPPATAGGAEHSEFVRPGFEEQRFLATRGTRHIPGVLWLPSSGADVPAVVLIQHGGSGDKFDPSVQEVAKALLSTGLGVAAIDGPIHGERRVQCVDKEVLLDEFLRLWDEDPQIEDFAGDWLHVIARLIALPRLRSARLGWFGLSMGTAYGLEVLSRCNAIEASVIGKWSSNYRNSHHLVSSAKGIHGSTLFIQHWDDEIFDRAGTLALFDAIGSRDKRLHVYTGSHFGRSREELEAAIAHLAQLKRPTAEMP